MKAVFLDVDGTLTTPDEPTSWQLLHKKMNTEKEGAKHFNLASEGKITYKEWADLDLSLWVGKPYSLVEEAFSSVELIGDLMRGIELLRQEFDIIYLVSGGIDVLVDSIRKKTKADYSISNSIIEKDGLITGEINLRIEKHKGTVIREIAKKNRINLDLSGAIGNHFNDFEMFEAVGTSIAFNSKSPKIDKISSAIVNSNSFIDPVEKIIELIRNRE